VNPISNGYRNKHASMFCEKRWIESGNVKLTPFVKIDGISVYNLYTLQQITPAGLKGCIRSGKDCTNVLPPSTGNWGKAIWIVMGSPIMKYLFKTWTIYG
jgi:hypothetical protein